MGILKAKFSSKLAQRVVFNENARTLCKTNTALWSPRISCHVQKTATTMCQIHLFHSIFLIFSSNSCPSLSQGISNWRFKLFLILMFWRLTQPKFIPLDSLGRICMKQETMKFLILQFFTFSKFPFSSTFERCYSPESNVQISHL